MSKKPWCPGSSRAAAPYNPWARERRLAACPVCNKRLELRGGRFPDHRGRTCLVPGCTFLASHGRLCSEHNREIVGTP